MKKVIRLIPILIFMACSNDKANVVDEDIQQEFKFSAKNFVNSTIAYEKNDVVKLGVTDENILKSFNDYSRKLELGTNAKSFSIEKIDGLNYLRFFHDDGAISTIALISNNEKLISGNLIITYNSGGTVCTTTACANCCGCIPEGSYCTRCEMNGDDCKRTTSGLQQAD